MNRIGSAALEKRFGPVCLGKRILHSVFARWTGRAREMQFVALLAFDVQWLSSDGLCRTH